MKRRKRTKQLTSLFVIAAMLLSMVTTGFVFAEDDTGLCSHHTEHTEACGYAEAVPEQPCTHECTEESGCVKTECIHTHDESCGYEEGVENSDNSDTPPGAAEKPHNKAFFRHRILRFHSSLTTI